MTNPIIHALVVLAAIIIPGGLLVYFAWRVKSRCQEAKAAKKAVDPIEEIRDAFLKMYPKESLRATSRRERLRELQRRRRRKIPK